MPGPNQFQVRRTSVADREANTLTLPNAGELALNILDGRMFSTNGATIFEVGANTKNCRVSNSFFVGNSVLNVAANSTQLTLANSTVNTHIAVPTSGQYSATNYFLHANGTWVQVSGGSGSVRVYQSFTATGGQTTYTVSGGYTIGQIEVYENGVHLANTEYTENGSTVVLGVGSLAGAIIEVSGWINMGSFSPVASGSNTWVQFNDSTAIGGSAGFTFDKATNTALVANTLTVGGPINANGTIGSSGDVLKSNGTGSYWGTVAGGSVGGSNTYVLFNDSTAANGVAGFTFDKAVNNAVIANTLTVGTATINSTKYSQTANNADYLGGVLAADYQTEAGLSANVAVLTSNNSLFLGGTAAASYQLNSTLAANVAILDANTAEFLVGANVISNTTGLYPLSNTSGAALGNTISRFNSLFGTVGIATTLTAPGHSANSLGIYPTSNTVGNIFGNTISRPVIVGNSATFSTTLSVTTGITGPALTANTLGLYPTSNSVGQNLGNTTARWDIALIGQDANTTGIYPLSNTSGQKFGNTISRWEIWSNTINVVGVTTLAAQMSNSTGFYPTSNTVGQMLGNTTARWDIALVGQDVFSTGMFPLSNTSGQLLGNTISRFVLVANSVATQGMLANAIGLYPTSNTVGQLFGNTISRWEITCNTVIASTGLTVGTAKYQTILVETVSTLTDGTTPALDASLGNIFTLTATADRTIAVPTNATNGQKIVIRHLASGGARTLALNTGAGGFRFGTDITDLTQTESGKTDYIGCIYNSTASFWDVVAYVKGL